MSIGSPFPAPTVSIELAARCPVARHMRDHQLATWCGMSNLEREQFIDHLQLFDARTLVIERDRRRAELRRLNDLANLDDLMAELRALVAAATVLPPRIDTPRIHAPRAAA